MKLEDFEERTELATRVSTWKQTIDVTLDEQVQLLCGNFEFS